MRLHFFLMICMHLMVDGGGTEVSFLVVAIGKVSVLMETISYHVLVSNLSETHWVKK